MKKLEGKVKCEVKRDEMEGREQKVGEMKEEMKEDDANECEKLPM